MEIKINREIRDYHESMFFGLSLRQSVFSLLAILSAVGLYFWLQPMVGTEIVSWVCVCGAAPFAVLGFVTYHGMPAEKFAWVWFRSEVLEPKQLCFKPKEALIKAHYNRVCRGNQRQQAKDEAILGGK